MAALIPKLTILIMAGGTGGHVFPALAVADCLARQGASVVWLGTRAGMESRLVPRHGYPIEWVTFSAVRGKGVLRWLLVPLSIVWACAQSVGVMRRRLPNVVLGMGGFAAFPGGLAAKLLRRPLVIHEQNSTAGLSNRVLAMAADRVLVGFPLAFSARINHPIAACLRTPRSVSWTGNPVRAEIATLDPPEQRFTGRQGSLRLLVIGGSLGAQVFNRTVPEALKLLTGDERPLVMHQAGEKFLAELAANYASAGVEGELVPFVDDMATQYARCDLVLCRAGALTVAELAAAGVASILVPFPFAVDDHQTGNAAFLSESHAALLVPQLEFSARALADLLRTLTREALLRMAVAARRLAKPDATEQVACACTQVAN